MVLGTDIDTIRSLVLCANVPAVVAIDVILVDGSASAEFQTLQLRHQVHRCADCNLVLDSLVLLVGGVIFALDVHASEFHFLFSGEGNLLGGLVMLASMAIPYWVVATPTLKPL